MNKISINHFDELAYRMDIRKDLRILPVADDLTPGNFILYEKKLSAAGNVFLI